ncbi:MAG: glycosyltransferase family 2 protein [Verrucomicrobia bacterium]|nr:glycosyltransferase family 2 protein [Verrucomicrobiota bacterium]
MRLSIIIPVYNERDSFDTLLAQVKAAPIGYEKEILVVDDCSQDGTRDVLARHDGVEGVRVFYHEMNWGKGAAIRTAQAHVTGDVVLIQDADLEYNPAEYPKLLAPIEGGKADVVYGSRFVGSEAHRVLYFWHMLANKGLTLLSNMLTNLNLTDMETCYKVFRAEVFQRITIAEHRFGFEPEVTAKVARLGVRVYEVGISYYGRTFAQGKKITWRDGLRALWYILKYNVFR